MWHDQPSTGNNPWMLATLKACQVVSQYSSSDCNPIVFGSATSSISHIYITQRAGTACPTNHTKSAMNSRALPHAPAYMQYAYNQERRSQWYQAPRPTQKSPILHNIHTQKKTILRPHPSISDLPLPIPGRQRHDIVKLNTQRPQILRRPPRRQLLPFLPQRFSQRIDVFLLGGLRARRLRALIAELLSEEARVVCHHLRGEDVGGGGAGGVGYVYEFTDERVSLTVCRKDVGMELRTPR